MFLNKIKYLFLYIRSFILYSFLFKKFGFLSIIRSPIINWEYVNHVSIGSRTRILGNNRIECLIKWNNKKYNPDIKIGNNVNIGHNFFITCASKIEICDGVLISDNVAIIDNEHQHVQNQSSSKTEIKTSEINIGKNVTIYRNTTILKGVKIGENSVIGANAIIKKNIPANSIVVGTGKIIGKVRG